ncbi:hypothetical protein RI367_008546 [Sorochytrium milnesiophthora]
MSLAVYAPEEEVDVDTGEMVNVEQSFAAALLTADASSTKAELTAIFAVIQLADPLAPLRIHTDCNVAVLRWKDMVTNCPSARSRSRTAHSREWSIIRELVRWRREQGGEHDPVLVKVNAHSNNAAEALGKGALNDTPLSLVPNAGCDLQYSAKCTGLRIEGDSRRFTRQLHQSCANAHLLYSLRNNVDMKDIDWDATAQALHSLVPRRSRRTTTALNKRTAHRLKYLIYTIPTHERVHRLWPQRQDTYKRGRCEDAIETRDHLFLCPAAMMDFADAVQKCRDALVQNLTRPHRRGPDAGGTQEPLGLRVPEEEAVRIAATVHELVMAYENRWHMAAAIVPTAYMVALQDGHLPRVRSRAQCRHTAARFADTLATHLWRDIWVQRCIDSNNRQVVPPDELAPGAQNDDEADREQEELIDADADGEALEAHGAVVPDPQAFNARPRRHRAAAALPGTTSSSHAVNGICHICRADICQHPEQSACAPLTSVTH